MAKNLINIQTLADAARARGFQVQGHSRYFEIWEPKFDGPKGVWNFDSQYSTSQFTLNDCYGLGYGYNNWFHGPRHIGMIQRKDCERLLSHPAMQGVEV